MPSTEIAIRDSAAVTERDVVDGWVSVVRDVGNLADYVAQTDFVPKALRGKPAAIAACILTGREMGIGPMTSLKVIHMVQGSPSLSAEFKRARALELGHEIVYEESTTTRCIVRGRRRGDDSWLTVTWHIDDAKRAKLTGKDVWQQHPRRMLQARATSELCDLKFPDCSWGLATTEVLEDGGQVLDDGTVTDAADAKAPPAAQPGQRTAQRRRAPRDASPAAPATAPQDAAPQPPTALPAAGEAPLPPLPGEDEPDPTTSGASSSAAAPASRSRQGTAEPSPGSPASSASEPDETDYDTPGTVTTPQITAIWTVLSMVYEFTKDEKDQARAVCAHVIGHPLKSTKDMSKNEAKAVLDTLSSWQEVAERHDEKPREFLIELLATAEKEGDGDA